MKSAIFSLLIFFLSTFPGDAQNVFSYPLTDSSRPEVKAISARIASHKLIKASFTQTKKISRLSRTLNSTGKMIFVVDRGLLWEVISPFPSVTIITSDRLVQKSASGKISTLSARDNDTFKRFSSTIQAIFKGNLPELERDFEIYYYKDTPSTWTIGLKPRDRTLRDIISSIEIHGAVDLEKFILTEANGDTVSYEFADITYPVELSAADEKAFF
ncbi:MAG: outer membrane lipoprotein carrier protein LolA [Spirochaetales bacterium]|nr:outer membrane lipoprotein carrier protein LolA [Spirochaetales bacterium]